MLDVSPEVAAARRRAPRGRAELFDDDDLQARLAAAYRRRRGLVPGDRVVHVDGDAPRRVDRPSFDAPESSVRERASPRSLGGAP